RCINLPGPFLKPAEERLEGFFVRKDAGVVSGFPQLLLRLQDRLIFVQQLRWVEWFCVPGFPPPFHPSLDAELGGRINIREDHAVTFAFQLVREPRHPVVTVAGNRYDSFAADMTLGRELVYAEEEVIRRATVAERGIQAATGSFVFAENEEGAILILAG